MIAIERLRALEKKYETRLENWTRLHAQDQQNDADGRWNRAHMLQCQDILDDLRTLIAELGQEVGAVAPDARFPDDGNGDDDAYNKGWNDCRAFTIASKYAKPSPAYTSEARDAARLDWLDKATTAGSVEMIFSHSDVRQLRGMGNVRQCCDAAMRQEGGDE